jgi:hypothetical protein
VTHSAHNPQHPGGLSSETPVYWECPGCGFLTDDPEVGAGKRACVACPGATPKPLRRFPPDRQRRLDERIRRYYSDGDYEVVVILGATFLETLLEDVLARIMDAQGASVQLQAAVLDGQRSVGQRLGKLFPTLTGEQFEDAVAALGFPDFSHRWRKLRSERNAFIHDSAFEGASTGLNKRSADDTMRLLGEAYRLFVSVNNRFVAGTERRR